MTAALLGIGFIAAALIANLLVFGVGSVILPPLREGRLSERMLSCLYTYATGLLAVSSLVTVVGLLGLLNAWVVGPALMLSGLAGWVRVLRAGVFSNLNIASRVHAQWKLLPGSHRILLAAGVLPLALFSMNIIVGGLAPDLAQDSLWYHLTLPGQWILLGDVRMFPFVMQSTLTLAAEAIYAPILLFGNELILHQFHAQLLLLVFFAMPVAAARFVGARASVLVACILIPLVGVTLGIAPVTVKNDRFAALFLLVGFCALLEGLEERGSRQWRLAILAGAFLGMLTAVKMVALAYWVPASVVYTILLARRHGPGRTVGLLATAAIVALFVYTPWLVRGAKYSGNPVYPLGKSLIEINPDFRPALEASAGKHQFYDLSWEGFLRFKKDAWRKAYIAQSNVDPVLALLFLSALGCLFRRKTRPVGLLILAMYTGLLVVTGESRAARFFTIVYPAGSIAIALFFHAIDRRLTSRLALAVWVLLLTGAFITYGRTQYNRSRLRTIQWPFRPVLTEPLLSEYVGKQALASSYFVMRQARSSIPKGASVLLPEAPYPYYLKHRVFWAGDAIDEGILHFWWDDMDAEEAFEDLQERHVDYVLTVNYPQDGDSAFSSIDERLLRMEKDGRLEFVAEGGESNWRLWRVSD